MKLIHYTPVFLFLSLLLSSCSDTGDNEYFVFLNTNENRQDLPEAEVRKIQEAHEDNLDRLAAGGFLFAAGPFDHGGGMMVLRTKDIEEARNLVNTDPAVKAGRFRVEVFPLSFIKGSICPWWEPIDMGSYGFFRFSQGPVKNKERLSDHFYHLSALEDEPRVLVQADFDDKGSGILILDMPLTDDWIEKVVDNQAIQEGAIEVDIKTLWIARGTFCD